MKQHTPKHKSFWASGKGKAVYLLVILSIFAFVISLYAPSSTKTSPQVINRRGGKLLWPHDIGEDIWPLKTNFARVYCENLGYGAKAVYLSTSPDGDNFYDYAVNGTARGTINKLGIEDVSTVMKDGLLPYTLDPFIKIGLKECE